MKTIALGSIPNRSNILLLDLLLFSRNSVDSTERIFIRENSIGSYKENRDSVLGTYAKIKHG